LNGKHTTDARPPENAAALPFHGIRVLEIGTGTGVAFCGKLFADFGAEVIKIEAPDGDPGRRWPPMIDIGDGQQESAYFAWLNTNKHSVVADLQTDAGLSTAGALVSSADVLLDARALDAQGKNIPALASDKLPPHLVEIIFTWFGESGAYRDYVATDAVCRALAGTIHSAGPVEGPPLIPHDSQSGIVAGLAAFGNAVAGLLGRAHGSRRFVLSIHEALLHLVEIDIGLALDGRHQPRSGINRFGNQYPASIYRASDGWVGIFTVTAAQWKGLCTAIGQPELAKDPRYLTGPDRLARADEVDAILNPIFSTRTVQEWFALCAAQRLPAVVVPTMEQLLAQAVHRERGAFVPVMIGQAGFEAPILPQRLGDAGPLRGGRAPLLGEHNSLYEAQPRTSAPRAAEADPASASAAPGRLPLEGIRIVDLTMGWAGPFATRNLADLGAEVIKVESTAYPDWWRGTNYSEEFYRDRLYEKNAYFNLMNRNKLDVTLDLTSAEGVRLLKELVAGADALIENYSAEVLPKLGLDYPALSQVNPRIVMLSMPAFGSNNAWSNTRAYGGTLEQASGLPTVTGEEHWPPTMTSYAYGDPIGGYNACTALLVGLAAQRKSGRGTFIDLSQVEGMLSLVAPFIIEQSVHGKVGPRRGNRHPVFTPHGCFHCKGNDDWIVISIATDAQWVSLCRAMGRDDLADDRTLATAAGRRQREGEIESAITGWTSTRSADEAMATLQQSRVPAGVARSIPDLFQDLHLQQRGFWQRIERPFVGNYLSGSSYCRERGQPAPVRLHAPTLGQHNALVLKDILGLTQEQFDALAAAGIIGTEAVFRAPKIRGATQDS
jgi:crotonobetainyl-CoA:carnitine CoA-transferase CaiB-like acyl-CoA transferase